MPLPRTNSSGKNLLRVVAATLAFALTIVASRAVAAASAASAPAFKLDLEVIPTAPFPFLKRFGTIALTIYPEGVRGEALWLNGYSREGSPDLVIENPLSRTYGTMPLSRCGELFLSLGGFSGPLLPGELASTLEPEAPAGTVKGIPARRYRIRLGTEAWIDVWTTAVVPKTAQYARFQTELLEAISPSVAHFASKIPGMPLYVELNTTRFKKLAIVQTRSLVRTSEGAEDDLSTGMIFFKVPFVEKLLQ